MGDSGRFWDVRSAEKIKHSGQTARRVWEVGSAEKLKYSGRKGELWESMGVLSAVCFRLSVCVSVWRV